ncbi:hypothetical protein M404DRAFT_25304 [Pisolithus tinctorius Marx 270]|uniref:Uncharacterized protein n=1 Tax=Pisolithus tinctorius Marx 270 TaxID=870435 RepID=A0A0C3PCV0_PISTI|nr:hypothetical protein M404DRAFT_25304 [Pisolithus tinctorius Marx 270]
MLQQVTFKITLRNENGDTTADSPVRWAVASLTFFVSQLISMLSHARGACACTCLLAQHQKLTDTSPQFLDLDVITPLKEHRAAGKEERTTGMIQASPSESVWGPKFRLSSDILMFVMLVFLFVLIGSDMWANLFVVHSV